MDLMLKNDMSFAGRLKIIRTQKGFSQSELGKRVGIHYTQVGRYENKGAQPTAEVLAKLAEALEVSADYLMNGTTDEQAETTISDKELLRQFKRLERLSEEQKYIVKELIDAFILKMELQQKLAS